MSYRILMLLVVLIELPIGVAMIVGALKMMRLQSYGWAMTATILAMLPCSPASLLSLAIAIWSLVELNRRNVRTAFQIQARSRAALRSSPAPSPSASEKTGAGPVSLPDTDDEPVSEAQSSSVGAFVIAFFVGLVPLFAAGQVSAYPELTPAGLSSRAFAALLRIAAVACWCVIPAIHWWRESRRPKPSDVGKNASGIIETSERTGAGPISLPISLPVGDTPNFGELAMGGIMLVLGLVLLACSTIPGAGVLQWVGLGIALGGGGCFAAAWQEDQRLPPGFVPNPGMLAMGGVMLLVGIVLLLIVAAYNQFAPPSTLAWTAIGIILGSGGCFVAAWQREEDTEEPETGPVSMPLGATDMPAIFTEPRLSRCALVGAIWAPLFFIAGLMSFVSMDSGPGEYTGPAWWQLALMFTLLPLGVLAPFGTTILGAVGITKIKRSGGKLYGLPLAAVDAFLFPLLILGFAASALTHTAQIVIWTKTHTGYVYESGVLADILAPNPADRPDMIFLILDAIAVLVVCLFTGRAMWRAVAGHPDAQTEKEHEAATLSKSEKARTNPVALPPSAPPTKRPKLVPVLATFNLVGAILLMLVCAMEEPAEFAKPIPRLWQVWETVDAVLGFAMAAGMFAASIGLFLWKPWARKVTLGVCVFGLASFVFDAPYLARFLLPDAYAEIQQTVIAEGVEPYLQDFVTLSTFVVIFGGMFVVGLTCLIGQLVYFTRPRVVTAFEAQGEQYGKFIEWLFSGAGAVVGVLSVFGPLALLLGVTALFNVSSGDKAVDTSADHTGSVARTPQVAPAESPLTIEQLFTLKGHTGYIYNVRFSPDGTRIASASHDGTAKVWDAETGAELFTCRGHTDYVHGLAYSSDGTRLATISQDGSARIWDAATGEEKLRVADRGVSNLAFSPDGARVVSAGNQNQIKVWNSATGEEILTLKRDGNSAFFNVAYSPDGKWIGASGMDGTLWLYDAASGREADIHYNSSSIMRGLAFDRESKRIATCTSVGHVRVSDVLTGELLFLVKLDGDGPMSVTFSPDGKWLANGTTDGYIRIWHATKEAPAYMPGHYREALTLKAHPRIIKSVVFNHDGTRLASGSDDKSVKVWKVTPSGLRNLQSDDARIQGTWNYVANMRDGQITDPEELKYWQVIFAQGEYTEQPADRFEKGTYKLDSTKTPKTIDCFLNEGPYKGLAVAGIYELDGDTLKICWSRWGSLEHPKEFEAAPGSERALIVLKRVSPVP